MNFITTGQSAHRLVEFFMDVKLGPSWKKHLEAEFSKDYFGKLVGFVKQEYASGIVYPPGPFIFRALDLTPFDQVRVVILGQDPYHGARQANGLAFSVSDEVKVPPSLQNIYKELESDLGKPMPASGNLERWANQGVLLLNATLTVRAQTPGSHQNKGWEEFTDAIVAALNSQRDHLVFILWGKYAQQKGALINRNKHLVLTAAHPSPYSAANGFFGSKPFSKTSAYLRAHGDTPIVW